MKGFGIYDRSWKLVSKEKSGMNNGKNKWHE